MCRPTFTSLSLPLSLFYRHMIAYYKEDDEGGRGGEKKSYVVTRWTKEKGVEKKCPPKMRRWHDEFETRRSEGLAPGPPTCLAASPESSHRSSHVGSWTLGCHVQQLQRCSQTKQTPCIHLQRGPDSKRPCRGEITRRPSFRRMEAAPCKPKPGLAAHGRAITSYHEACMDCVAWLAGLF